MTREELADDGEFEDIQEDVKGECSTYGVIESMIIPRERDGFRASTEGSIYVMYQNPDMARAASAALSGRKFANRIVTVDYVSKHHCAFTSVQHFLILYIIIVCLLLYSLTKVHSTGGNLYKK